MKALLFEGSPGEIAELLERMPQLNSLAQAVSPRDSAPASSPSGFSLWTAEKVAKIWSEMYGDQKKLVEFIVAKGGKVAVTEAQRHLGLKRGPAIAGVVSSITRNARRITKYREARLVDHGVAERNGSTAWCYRIPDPVLALLRQAISTTNA